MALIYPLPFYATQIINIFLKLRISANHDKGEGHSAKGEIHINGVVESKLYSKISWHNLAKIRIPNPSNIFEEISKFKHWIFLTTGQSSKVKIPCDKTYFKLIICYMNKDIG